MSHLSRADADKLLDLVMECRTTARREARAIHGPDEAAWSAADDAAFKAVATFVHSLEVKS